MPGPGKGPLISLIYRVVLSAEFAANATMLPLGGFLALRLPGL